MKKTRGYAPKLRELKLSFPRSAKQAPRERLKRQPIDIADSGTATVREKTELEKFPSKPPRLM